jgi:thioredoxin reductase (NADPH)
LESTFEIVVVGGGIAGLTAGLTSARLGRKTLVLTGPMLGGHLLSIESIEGYPGYPEGVAGYELCPAVQSQASAAGAEFAMSEALAVDATDDGWCVRTPSGNYSAAAVIVATGAVLEELDVPGEAALRGKGVSHCASCDAPLLRERTCVVVGGGDSALQEALRLADDAAAVHVVHRGETLSAQASFRERVNACDRISFHPHTEVVEILGDGAVSAVRLINRSAGESRSLEAAGVFVYIGLRGNSGLLADRVAIDSDGRIATDAGLRTPLRGVFAAGTVRAGSAGRAVAAAGEGALAAIRANDYVLAPQWPGAA